jgi:hypothetical protein
MVSRLSCKLPCRDAGSGGFLQAALQERLYAGSGSFLQAALQERLQAGSGGFLQTGAPANLGWNKLHTRQPEAGRLTAAQCMRSS